MNIDPETPVSLFFGFLFTLALLAFIGSLFWVVWAPSVLVLQVLATSGLLALLFLAFSCATDNR